MFKCAPCTLCCARLLHSVLEYLQDFGKKITLCCTRQVLFTLTYFRALCYNNDIDYKVGWIGVCWIFPTLGVSKTST
jgi:hypothetical protein